MLKLIYWGFAPAIMLLLAEVSVESRHAAYADEGLRLPTTDEVLALAEHLRDYPPWRSDVTVIVEFELDSVPETQLRKEVRNSIVQDNRSCGLPVEGEEIDREVDREVRRLLAEQLKPRRIKERWRREGMSYRVDEVRTSTGDELIDEETPFDRGFLYLYDETTETADTALIDYEGRLVAVFGPRHGNVQQFRDAWAGGTLGRVSVPLKAGLGMPLFDEHGGDPDPGLVEELVNGSHRYMQLLVRDMQGQRHGREFVYRPANGGEIRFKTPATSIEPVYEVAAQSADGSLEFSLFSEEITEESLVRKWIERMPHPSGKRLKEVKFTLLSRAIGEPMADDTFSVEPVDGWYFEDHRPEQLVAIGPDGNPMQYAGQGTGPAIQGSAGSYSQTSDLLFWNGLVLAFGIPFVAFLRRRVSRSPMPGDG